MLLPPGGHVELHETPWAAVLHEIEEESGFSAEQLQVLQPAERITRMDGTKVHPVPLFLQTHEFKKDMGHFHVDVGFLFVVDGDPMHSPEDGESAELFWLTNLQIQERKSEMPEDIAQIYDFCFTTALPSWETIPSDRYEP